MSTRLIENIIFGPIKSRRLGISLGVNLLPVNHKICSFNCVYCECGYNEANHKEKNSFATREEVRQALKQTLEEMSAANKPLDTITFSGNGEPTMHPQFEGIIDDTIELRNRFYPETKISVLSNSTMIHKESVFRALNKVDNNILKLDASIDKLMKLIDQPGSTSFNIKDLTSQLKRFNGNLIIQTIFLRGSNKGESIDNTTEENVSGWLRLLKEIHPKQVMIYSLDRDTPSRTLEKVERAELESIAKKVEQLGIPVVIA